MSNESVISSNHLILPCLYQHQGLFQWVSSWHQVAKVLEFSFSNSPSREYSGLISCRIDWFDLLEVQGTLKSLLQYHIQKHHFFVKLNICLYHSTTFIKSNYDTSIDDFILTLKIASCNSFVDMFKIVIPPFGGKIVIYACSKYQLTRENV